MLKRIYVHNFRCFENFEFRPLDSWASLLLGSNGSGKSTLKHVLAIFQSIGRGKTRVGELVKPTDFTRGNTSAPMRFELEVALDGHVFVYTLALELPHRFKEVRVLEEKLSMDGNAIFSRDIAEVAVPKKKGKEQGTFTIDWHLAALPVIGTSAASNRPDLVRWMARMVLLAPVPQQISGEAQSAEIALNQSANNLADWLADLLEGYPAAYTTIVEHLQHSMPDLTSFRFERLGRDSRALMVQFSKEHENFELSISDLSDGEKCFFLSGVLLAANQLGQPLFAFWDEPDNYLAVGEVNQFIVSLKRNFVRRKGQLFVTSHNPETVNCFSQDSIWVMGRRNRLEPTIVRRLDELSPPSRSNGDEDADIKVGRVPTVVERMIAGDIYPWL